MMTIRSRLTAGRFSLFFGTFDAIVLMASIYILFPREHPELVQSALQHFQWAVERFQAMSGRNSLTKAALGVLHAVYLRLKKSLGVTGQTAQWMLTSGGSSSTSPASGTASGSSMAASLWNSPSTTTTSFNPSPSMDPKATTLCSATLPTPGGDDFPAPRHPQMDDTPHRTNPAPDFNFNFNFNLDPELFPADHNATATAAAGGSTTALDWNPPSNIDWCSLQPIYATSDLVYHDLVGTGAQADGAVGAAWGFHDGGRGGGVGQGEGLGLGQGQGQGQGRGPGRGQSQSQGVDAAGAAAVGLVGGQGQGQDVILGMGDGAAAPSAAGGEGGLLLPGYCLFGGDFGDDSVWSLLNQYTPF